jgi:hypothetical protein
VVAVKSVTYDFIAGMPVSTNAILSRYTTPFGALSAAEGSRKAVIMPAKRFAETLVISNVRLSCQTSPYLAGTFMHGWHATWRRIRKMLNVMSRSKL